MAFWLLKTEPGEYSHADLERDKKTAWSGVSNPVALKNIRSMKKGDEALVYHTGNEKQVVGLAKIASDPYADPKEPKLAVVDLEAGPKLPQPVTLAQIKADKSFEGFDLIRIGRLSVVSVPPAMWKRIMQLAKMK